MEVKSFVYGCCTITTIICIVFGINRCERQQKVRHAEHRELIELREQNAQLQKDTANYRKLIREASLDLKSKGCSDFYVTQNYKSWEQ